MAISQSDGHAREAETPGERLRKLRERAGIPSGSQAAVKLGMPLSTYLQHENGSSSFGVRQAQAYAKFYGVPAAVILYGDEAVIYPDTAPQERIRVIGQVDERGLVLPMKGGEKPDPRAKRHWLKNTGLTDAAILQAVVVNTNALAPHYFRGDHVLFQPLVRGLRVRELRGKDAVFTTSHSRTMLAVLHRSDGKGWNIHVANREPLKHREVFRASVVRWIKRA